MELVHRGAEAVLFRDGDKMVKRREPKSYRLPVLDERLRSSRTRREAKVLRRLDAAGVPVPGFESSDDTTITMSFVDAAPLASSLEPSQLRAVGEAVATMHDTDVTHGDLTTSNILEGPVLIDFGLAQFSQKIEDKAVDLHVLRGSLAAHHTAVQDAAWNAFVDGYRRSSSADAVITRLEEVQQRGRYK